MQYNYPIELENLMTNTKKPSCNNKVINITCTFARQEVGADGSLTQPGRDILRPHNLLKNEYEVHGNYSVFLPSLLQEGRKATVV